MSDGREFIGHKVTCATPEIVVERARVTCTDCGRFAPRTDIPAGVCQDCGGNCRPDMPVCAECRNAQRLRGEPVTIRAATTTPPPPIYRGAVCRGCHKPAPARVKPGRGFVCPCESKTAA